MDSLSAARISRAAVVRIATTQVTQFIDITDRVESFLTAVPLSVGLINIQSLHTTAAIVVNENEPLLLADFRALLERTVCQGMGYRHDDMSRRANVAADEPANGCAHCRALGLPSAASLNVVDGRLVLGRWQRVFLVELDGPRTRDISFVALGEPR
jgi:secondary thiamine-phosphate synthase enzyme